MTEAIDKHLGLTAERVRELLAYDPETGKFRWKVSHGYAYKGTLAGCVYANGYIIIGVDDTRHTGHRLAWLYMTGEWPPDQIDHVNGNRNDNCFSNLRLATRVENSRNRKIASNNRSGIKGVCWVTQKRKWRAQIMINKHTITLGDFTNIEDAAAAYEAAANKYFGEFARPERETRKQPPVNLRELGLLD
jgi:hypothetical protein